MEFFSKQPTRYDILNALGIKFARNDGFIIKQWNKEFLEYVNVEEEELINNVTKVIIIENEKQQQIKQDEAQLRKHLLEGYDSQVWPWDSQKKPCKVSININFHKVLDVDMAKGMLNMLVWLRIRWFDPRLAWNETEWNGIDTIWFDDGEFNLGEFWNPKIELWNSEEPMGFYFYPQPAQVTSDGEVFWSRNGQMLIACDFLGQRFFPYDRSSCIFEMGSWVYDQSRVDLHLFEEGYAIGGSISSGVKSKIAQYKLWQVQTQRYTYDTYVEGIQQEGWPVVLYKVTFLRQHINFTLKIMMPQVILSMVSLGAFWLSPSSSERISFAITLPVALAVYDLLVYQQLPESQTMVFASTLGIGCFLFSMGVVLQSIVVVVLWQKKDPYFLSPWRSIKKLVNDFNDQRDWVIVLRSIDEELTKLGLQRKPGKTRSERITRVYTKNRSLQKVGTIKESQVKQMSQQTLSCEISLPVSESEQKDVTTEKRDVDVRQMRVKPTVSFKDNERITTKIKPRDMNVKQSQAQQSSQFDFSGNENQHPNTRGDIQLVKIPTSKDFHESESSQLQRVNSNNIEADNDNINVDISWLDNLTLGDLSTGQKIAELVHNIFQLQLYVKGRKWVGFAVNRLIKRHGVNAFENRILSLMGIHQSQAQLTLKNYREESSEEYNEKWKMLSTFIDRASQVVFVLAFFVFIVYMFVSVVKANKGCEEDLFIKVCS